MNLDWPPTIPTTDALHNQADFENNSQKSSSDLVKPSSVRTTDSISRVGNEPPFRATERASQSNPLHARTSACIVRYIKASLPRPLLVVIHPSTSLHRRIVRVTALPRTHLDAHLQRSLIDLRGQGSHPAASAEPEMQIPSIKPIAAFEAGWLATRSNLDIRG